MDSQPPLLHISESLCSAIIQLYPLRLLYVRGPQVFQGKLNPHVSKAVTLVRMMPLEMSSM